MTMNIEILYEKLLDMISKKMIVIALIGCDFDRNRLQHTQKLIWPRSFPSSQKFQGQFGVYFYRNHTKMAQSLSLLENQ